jgi:hypothetical protein
MTRKPYRQRLSHFTPKPLNSPFCAPPRNACHSSDVNRRTGPAGSLLLRRPTPPSGRLATSTQLPLEKLRELLTQQRPEPSPSGEFPIVGLSTSYLTDRHTYPGDRLRVAVQQLLKVTLQLRVARISDTIRAPLPHRQDSSANNCPTSANTGQASDGRTRQTRAHVVAPGKRAAPASSGRRSQASRWRHHLSNEARRRRTRRSGQARRGI